MSGKRGLRKKGEFLLYHGRCSQVCICTYLTQIITESFQVSSPALSGIFVAQQIAQSWRMIRLQSWTQIPWVTAKKRPGVSWPSTSFPSSTISTGKSGHFTKRIVAAFHFTCETAFRNAWNQLDDFLSLIKSCFFCCWCWFRGPLPLTAGTSVQNI